ncbi:MAG TPA: serine hydrolase [Candidatus Pacearchaeota archaeon]|nr:serine hydrolase [Candidatus Pacearchaeota archaeon]
MERNNWFFSIFLLIFLSVFLIFGCKENVLGQDSLSFGSLEEISLFRPLKKEGAKDLELKSQSYLSVLIDHGKEKIFLEKNSDKKVYIASLTKMMTAVIALENYSLEDQIAISKKAIDTFGIAGEFREGEIFSVKDLLYILLVESSNDAAEALAEKIGRENFVSLMNQKAQELEMENTVFLNPSGLDFDPKEENQSTARDLKKLMVYIINNHPLIPEILSIYEMEMYHQGQLHHKMRSTNVLLNEDSLYLWGKTGYTEKAMDCIALVMRRPFSSDPNSYIINIIIGAPNRFQEARMMEQWLKESFYW